MSQINDRAAWPSYLPQQRYGGGGLDWSIARLAPADRAAIENLYSAMLALLGDYKPSAGDRLLLDRLSAWLEAYDWRVLRRDVAAAGPDTYAQFGTSPVLRKVMHDLRGGPMTTLSLDLSYMALGRLEYVDAHRVFLLTRDVCKIMRNSFPDIDQAGYSADQALKRHSVRLLVDKWEKMSSTNQIVVTTEFQGAIAESCIEFSALDRVLYNCMNNALREHAVTDAPVCLVLEVDDRTTPKHMRVVIENRVSKEQQLHLKTKFGDDLGPLFTTNFSTTGSGLGLQVVADFAARAYDVTVQDGLAAGYFGAVVEDEVFRLWFHWPVADA